MTFNPIDNGGASIGAGKVDTFNELQEIDFSTLDFDAIEKKASLFVKGTKFVAVGEEVKLVSVEKDGKIIYEDDGKMQFAGSQSELAEYKNEEDNAFKGFWGGFFGKPKSAFDRNKSNFA